MENTEYPTDFSTALKLVDSISTAVEMPPELVADFTEVAGLALGDETHSYPRLVLAGVMVNLLHDFYGDRLADWVYSTESRYYAFISVDPARLLLEIYAGEDEDEGDGEAGEGDAFPFEDADYVEEWDEDARLELEPGMATVIPFPKPRNK